MDSSTKERTHKPRGARTEVLLTDAIAADKEELAAAEAAEAQAERPSKRSTTANSELARIDAILKAANAREESVPQRAAHQALMVLVKRQGLGKRILNRAVEIGAVDALKRLAIETKSFSHAVRAINAAHNDPFYEGEYGRFLVSELTSQLDVKNMDYFFRHSSPNEHQFGVILGVEFPDLYIEQKQLFDQRGVRYKKGVVALLDAIADSPYENISSQVLNYDRNYHPGSYQRTVKALRELVIGENGHYVSRNLINFFKDFAKAVKTHSDNGSLGSAQGNEYQFDVEGAMFPCDQEDFLAAITRAASPAVAMAIVEFTGREETLQAVIDANYTPEMEGEDDSPALSRIRQMRGERLSVEAAAKSVVKAAQRKLVVLTAANLLTGNEADPALYGSDPTEFKLLLPDIR